MGDINGCIRADVPWGRTRLEKCLIEHSSHVPRPVIQLFQNLYQIWQATRGRKSTQNFVHKSINPDTFVQRGQANLVDQQIVPDKGTKFSYKTLMARINQLWKGTRIVHGRPHHPQDQGSVERANGNFQEHALRPTQGCE